MALRFALLGLAACLGWNLPEGPSAPGSCGRRSCGEATPRSAWRELLTVGESSAGQRRPACCASRRVGCVDGALVDRPSRIEVVEEPMVEPTVTLESNTPEDRFLAVVDAMAESFAAKPAAEVSTVEVVAQSDDGVASPKAFDLTGWLGFEVRTVVETEPDASLYPGVAYALNHEHDGLGDTEPVAPEPPNFAAVVAPAEVVESIEVAAVACEPEPPARTRGERLATAVQLTAQAVHAWVSILQQAPPTPR
jgi:hypothetical protein